MECKKIISGLLASAMLISLIPGLVYADETGDIAVDLTWSFDEETKTLTISGNGAMESYYYDNPPWMDLEEETEHVVIEEGITKIDYGAFVSFEELVSVSLPEGLEEIGPSAFFLCSRLEEITIPESVTCIDEAAFAYCSSLESVEFEGWSMLESIMNNAFCGCSGLRSLEIPSSVFYIDQYAFTSCNNLKDIYCFAYPDTLTWETYFERSTTIHVFAYDLEAFEDKFGGNSNAEFAGDLHVVSIIGSDNGTVSVDHKITMPGDLITFTATPDSGYVVIGIDVLDDNYEPIDYDPDTLSFTYPEDCEYVTIYIAFSKPDGWEKLEDGSYVYHEDGLLATGWKKISGKYYYFNEEGIMQTGWIKDGSKWYYLKSSGAMATGWLKISGKYYYFNSNGSMKTGWLQDGGKWYYLKSSGAMATGWQKVSNKWYYLDTSGAMVTGWKKISDKWYYFQSSGVMQTSDLVYKGKTYHFNPDGSCKNP